MVYAGDCNILNASNGSGGKAADISHDKPIRLDMGRATPHGFGEEECDSKYAKALIP